MALQCFIKEMVKRRVHTDSEIEDYLSIETNLPSLARKLSNGLQYLISGMLRMEILLGSEIIRNS